MKFLIKPILALAIIGALAACEKKEDPMMHDDAMMSGDAMMKTDTMAK